MSGIPILVTFLVVFAAGAAAFYYMPKSENQVLWRTCVSLTLACTWTMWAVTYLAQLNPLIVPERGFGEGSHAGDGLRRRYDL